MTWCIFYTTTLSLRFYCNACFCHARINKRVIYQDWSADWPFTTSPSLPCRFHWRCTRNFWVSRWSYRISMGSLPPLLEASNSCSTIQSLTWNMCFASTLRSPERCLVRPGTTHSNLRGTRSQSRKRISKYETVLPIPCIKDQHMIIKIPSKVYLHLWTFS